MLVTARLVVVAFAKIAFVEKRLSAVSAVEDAYGNCDAATVDDEKKTPCVKSDEVVAEVVVPNVRSEVNGYELPALPTWSAAQPNWPLVHVMKFPAEQLVRFAPYNKVVEAYDAEIFVVDAFANVCVPPKTLFAYVFGMVVDASAKNIAEVVEKKSR